MKMHIIHTSLLIPTFFSLTTAVPTIKPFNLVTSSTNTASNNLYLSTQTTGPLDSNPVFRDPANAATFYLANSTVNYEAPNKGPWALALVNGDAVQGNVEVSVSPRAGFATSRGFRITEDGNLSSGSPKWGGWLVCPGQGTSLLELFYEDLSAGNGVSDACHRVQLNVIYKSS